MRAYGVNIVRLFTNGGPILTLCLSSPPPSPSLAFLSRGRPAVRQIEGREVVDGHVPERQRDAAGEVVARKGQGI